MSRVLSNQKQLAVQDGPKKWKTARLPEPWGRGKRASGSGAPHSTAHSRHPCGTGATPVQGHGVLFCVRAGTAPALGPGAAGGKERVRAASAS